MSGKSRRLIHEVAEWRLRLRPSDLASVLQGAVHHPQLSQKMHGGCSQYLESQQVPYLDKYCLVD